MKKIIEDGKKLIIESDLYLYLDIILVTTKNSNVHDFYMGINCTEVRSKDTGSIYYAIRD